MSCCTGRLRKPRPKFRGAIRETTDHAKPRRGAEGRSGFNGRVGPVNRVRESDDAIVDALEDWALARENVNFASWQWVPGRRLSSRARSASKLAEGLDAARDLVAHP